MRNIFYSILSLIALVIFSSSAVYADNRVSKTRRDNTVTTVRGNVYNIQNGVVGIGNLIVTVNCNGNIKNPITDGFGLYEVNYPKEQCDKFDFVTSSVTYNGEPQTQTVQVSSTNTATLDFYYGAASVPEFGAIPGAIAAVGSGITFLGLKKKKYI